MRLLLLPETLIAAKYQILSIFEMIQLYGLGLAVLMLFQAYLYKHGGILEDMMKPVLIRFRDSDFIDFIQNSGLGTRRCRITFFLLFVFQMVWKQ